MKNIQYNQHNHLTHLTPQHTCTPIHPSITHTHTQIHTHTRTHTNTPTHTHTSHPQLFYLTHIFTAPVFMGTLFVHDCFSAFYVAPALALYAVDCVHRAWQVRALTTGSMFGSQ